MVRGMRRRMGIQECALDFRIAIANLTQHPAHGLVNEVFTIIEQQSRDAQRVIMVALPDVAQRGEHGDASIPEIA